MSMGAAAEFDDETVRRIAVVLPSEAPSERVALLPKLLRAWAVEDLQDHLARESRSSIEQRQQRLVEVGKKARDLLNAISTLDEAGRHEIATATQLLQEAMGNSLSPRWAILGFPRDPKGGERRRDNAISWLHDLANTFAFALKAPPDKRTLGYLVVLDLAAIYQLVTRTQPARCNNPYTDDGQQAYGPFWEFCSAIFKLIGLRSLDRAMRDVLDDYAGAQKARSSRKSARQSLKSAWRHAYSPFVANLQFRHSELWQELR